MLDLPIVQSPPVEQRSDDELIELKRRMKMPQRHRLLHGYPQAAAMPMRYRLAEFPFRDLEFGLAGDRGLPAYFGSDPLDDFPLEFKALTQEGLIDVNETSIKPTSREMFYADSIAVLWAWRRLRSLREEVLSLVHDESSPLSTTSGQADRAALSSMSSRNKSEPGHMG